MPNYYGHQHGGNPENPDHVLVSSMYDRTGGGKGIAAVNPDAVIVATGSMMRDYKKPSRRGRDNPDRPLCEVDDCRAYPMKSDDHGLCVGHARSAGILKPKQTKKVRDDELE